MELKYYVDRNCVGRIRYGYTTDDGFYRCDDRGEYLVVLSDSGGVMEHVYVTDIYTGIRLDHPLSDNEKLMFKIKHGVEYPFLPNGIVEKAYEV